MAAYFEDGSPAMAQLTAIVDRLEQMVDHAGLANLFYALEAVCEAKARTNPTTAWHWMRFTNTLAQGAHAANMVEMEHKPTCLTDSASGGTEMTQLFSTTSAIFRGSRLLIAD